MFVFVLIPHNEEFNDVYMLLKQCVESIASPDFSVERAGDIASSQQILSDIVEKIKRADIVIADVTGQNPNVMYELGLAHALRKRTFIITREIDDLPFDLKPYRVIDYSVRFSQWSAFAETIQRYLTEAASGKIVFNTPITDFYDRGPSVEPVQVETVETRIPQPADDLGLLDHVERVVSGMKRLTMKSNKFTASVHELGEGFKTDTLRLERQRVAGDTSTAFFRKMAKRAAERLQSFCDSVKGFRNEYKEVWSSVDDLVQFIFSSMQIRSNEDLNKVKETISTYLLLLLSVRETREKQSVFSSIIQSMYGVERHMNRAISMTVSELTALDEQMGIVEASLDRAIALIERRLKEFGETAP